MYRSDCVVAVRLELRNINSTDAMCLNRVDVDNEAVLERTDQLPFFIDRDVTHIVVQVIAGD